MLDFLIILDLGGGGRVTFMAEGEGVGSSGGKGAGFPPYLAGGGGGMGGVWSPTQSQEGRG